jgi:hypothetical protein
MSPAASCKVVIYCGVKIGKAVSHKSASHSFGFAYLRYLRYLGNLNHMQLIRLHFVRRQLSRVIQQRPTLAFI